ncbi:MAG: Flp family type IVb pilin [Desulfobulbaceae bacterium]|nr:Flp family type IVb pilin [Desulfobulbaceae bacterium]
MLNIFLVIKLSLEVMLNKLFDVKLQKGVTMIEYALIASLIAVAVIVILTTVGTNLNNVFTYVSGKLTTP